MRSAPLVGLAVALASCLAARAAAASEGSNSIFLGNEAALRAGAITAIANDGSAAWYNPAGLAKIKNTNLDVSLNMYGIRFREVREGHQVVFPDGVETMDLKDTRVYVVPSAVVFSKQFRPGLVGAVAVFVTESDTFGYAAELRQRAGPIEADGPEWVTDHRFDVQVNNRTYVAGPSLGFRIIPQLTMGFALMGVFRDSSVSYQLYNHSRPPEAADAGPPGDYLLAETNRRVRNTQIGLFLSMGMQWAVTDHLDLGFTIRSPTLMFIRNPDELQTESYTLNVPGEELARTYFPEVNTSLRAEFGMISNLRVDLGFAYHWKKVSLSVDGNIRPANPAVFPSPLFANPSFSLRTGALINLSDFVTLGTGVYMDRSGADPTRFVEDIDFYGLTLGLRLERKLWRRLIQGPKGWKELAEGESWKRKKREDIYASKVSLSTTIGVRYGFGYGRATTTRFDLRLRPDEIADDNFPAEVVPLSTDFVHVFSHDLTFFLGSQITF